MRYRLVVWDFDGTLANSFPLAVSTFNDLAAQRGYLPISDPEQVRGLTLVAFLRQHRVSLLSVPWLVRQYLAASRQRMATVPLVAGLAEVLTRLTDHGYRLGVLSSNTTDNVLACLKANGVAGLFRFVVGYPRLFGKGRVLRRLARQERVDTRELLYVGDEVRDLEAARHARVASAAVTWGFNNTALLSQQRPTHLWHHPADVLAGLDVPITGHGPSR